MRLVCMTCANHEMSALKSPKGTKDRWVCSWRAGPSQRGVQVLGISSKELNETEIQWWQSSLLEAKVHSKEIGVGLSNREAQEALTGVFLSFSSRMGYFPLGVGSLDWHL